MSFSITHVLRTIMVLGVTSLQVFAQSSASMESVAHPRVGLSAGMGVSYVSPQDIVDYVNGRSGQRFPEFKSAVEFFGSATVPVSDDWVVKVEYAYLLGTYNVNGLFGPQEYTFSAHMPTVIGQYVLVQENSYNVKVGAGLGYHFGKLSESGSFGIDLSGSGVGTVVDLEANTAFSENFFGCLGGNLRWDFIGDLTAPNHPITAGTVPTLHFFSLGARFGFTYYF